MTVSEQIAEELADRLQTAFWRDAEPLDGAIRTALHLDQAPTSAEVWRILAAKVIGEVHAIEAGLTERRCAEVRATPRPVSQQVASEAVRVPARSTIGARLRSMLKFKTETEVITWE